MKKLFLFAVMLALSVGIGIGQAPTFIWAADTVSIQKVVEIMPARNASEHPKNSIAMQAVWDPKRATWRRQIIPFNGATGDMVTEEMKRLAEQLVPDRIGIRDWESWKFTIIYPAEGASEKIVGKSETVTASAKDTSTAVPFPKTQQPAASAPPPPPPATSDPGVLTLLNDMKVKLTALEAAEANRLGAAKAPAKPASKPAAAVKRQPMITPLAACQANARNLELKKGEAEKSLGECQTGLEATKKSKADEVAKAEKKIKDNYTDTVAKLQHDLKKAYDNAGYPPWIVALLALLAFLAGIVVTRFVKKLSRAATTPIATSGPKAP